MYRVKVELKDLSSFGVCITYSQNWCRPLQVASCSHQRIFNLAGTQLLQGDGKQYMVPNWRHTLKGRPSLQAAIAFFFEPSTIRYAEIPRVASKSSIKIFARLVSVQTNQNTRHNLRPKPNLSVKMVSVRNFLLNLLKRTQVSLPGANFIELLKQKILLTGCLLSRHEQHTSHNIVHVTWQFGW